jgi:hypothetical protein
MNIAKALTFPFKEPHTCPNMVAGKVSDNRYQSTRAARDDDSFVMLVRTVGSIPLSALSFFSSQRKSPEYSGTTEKLGIWWCTNPGLTGNIFPSPDQ